MSKLDELIICTMPAREIKPQKQEDKFKDAFFALPEKITGETVPENAPEDSTQNYPMVFSGIRDEAKYIDRTVQKSGGGTLGIFLFSILVFGFLAVSRFTYSEIYNFTRQNIEVKSSINFIEFFNGDFSSLKPQPQTSEPVNNIGIFIPNILASKVTPLANGIKFEGIYQKFICLKAEGLVLEINPLKEVKVELESGQVILVKGLGNLAVKANDKISESTILGDVTVSKMLEVLTLN